MQYSYVGGFLDIAVIRQYGNYRQECAICCKFTVDIEAHYGRRICFSAIAVAYREDRVIDVFKNVMQLHLSHPPHNE